MDAAFSCFPPTWRFARGRTLPLDQPRLLGILNATPDSFSDGGLHLDPAAAAGTALQMIRDGAAGVDIGGESTRPGSISVGVAEQIARVIPVVHAVRAALGPDPIITIDTTRAAVAAAALDAGADAINDQSAGRDDPDMFALAARRGAGLILMHRVRAPRDDAFSTAYANAAATPLQGDAAAQVRAFLAERAAAALDSGIAIESLVVDPGLGFGKTVEDNLKLIDAGSAIGQFEISPRRRDACPTASGIPVLSALSRKSFTAPAGKAIEERLAGTLALSVRHFHAGVRLFRVHDVAAHVDALMGA